MGLREGGGLSPAQWEGTIKALVRQTELHWTGGKQE